MSAVVASLPAPAVTAPHALIVAPPEGGGNAKLLFHPFFPLLHFMHLPHLFLHRPFGHHGLGGFHHGLGGLGGIGGYHHGLGGHGGLGGFPFRSLPTQVTGNDVSFAGNAHDDDDDGPPSSAEGNPSPTTSPDRQSESLSVPGAPPEAPATETHGSHASHGSHNRYAYYAYITPGRKVIPASAVSAVFSALPPLPYAHLAPPAAYVPPHPLQQDEVGPPRPPSAAPSLSAAPIVVVEAGVPAAPVTPPQGPQGPQGPTAPDVDVFLSVRKVVTSTPPPLPASKPALHVCECKLVLQEEQAARIELDHSLEESNSSRPVTSETPGPLAPPPTVPTAQEGLDSSPEAPERKDGDDSEDVPTTVIAATDTAVETAADPSDSRVLILVDEFAAVTPEAPPEDTDASDAPSATTTELATFPTTAD